MKIILENKNLNNILGKKKILYRDKKIKYVIHSLN